MNTKTFLGFVLVLCVAGCSSVTTNSLHCTSLAREEQELIHSDLNRMLVSDGFTAPSPSEVPWAMGCWANSSFSPLWEGRAYFQVSSRTNSSGLDIDVFYYQGRKSANKALVEAIVGCVQSNAPNAKIKIKTSKQFPPAFMGE